VVQGLSSIVEAVPFGFGKRAAIDMDSPLVRGASWLYYQVSRVTSKLYPDYWGFFHVGQVLQVDPAAAADTVKSLDTASKHNLEVRRQPAPAGLPTMRHIVCNSLLQCVFGQQSINSQH
jgi:hypothetical protein